MKTKKKIRLSRETLLPLDPRNAQGALAKPESCAPMSSCMSCSNDPCCWE